MRYRDVDVRTYIIFEEDCTNTLKIILNSSWRESRKYCRFVENIVHCNVENTFDTSYQAAVTVSVSGVGTVIILNFMPTVFSTIGMRGNQR